MSELGALIHKQAAAGHNQGVSALTEAQEPAGRRQCCKRCRHPIWMHVAAYRSPAGDDGTMGKHGYSCMEYNGCGCWLDVVSATEPEQETLPFG